MTPATDNAPPASRPSSTRGRRMSKTISLSGDTLPQALAKVTSAEPTSGKSSALAMTARMPAINQSGLLIDDHRPGRAILTDLGFDMEDVAQARLVQDR